MLETDSQKNNSHNEVHNLLYLIKSQNSHNNLYEHLQKLFETKVHMNDDKKFIDLLEDISIRIKEKGTYFIEEKVRESLLHYLEEFNKNSKQKKALLNPLVKLDPDGGDPQVITEVKYVPEYHNIFQYLEWVGISLGEKESFLLTNSLRNLSFNKNLPNGVTFWGKIFGTEKDYYIVEASGVEPNNDNNNQNQEEQKDLEKRNEDGINKNTYYVTNDLTSEWIELPDIKPEQLRAARKIRYIFTGNLKRNIVTNPHFPGLEKELLRCQIARISHGVKIEPSIDHWKVDTDAPFKPLEKNPDAKPMKPNDYLLLKNWIHFYPGIINQGRVQHYIEVPDDTPDADEYRKKEIDKDPFDKRARPISEDSYLNSSIPNVKIPAWKLQYLYDDKIYINNNIKLNPDDPEEQKDNTENYAVICLRSLRWPGAHVVKIKNEIHTLYFGWGQKFADYTLGEKFVYQDFPIIPRDINDYEEFPEPNSPPNEGNPNDLRNDNNDPNNDPI